MPVLFACKWCLLLGKAFCRAEKVFRSRGMTQIPVFCWTARTVDLSHCSLQNWQMDWYFWYKSLGEWILFIQHSEKLHFTILKWILWFYWIISLTIAHFYIYLTLIQSNAEAKVIHDHKARVTWEIQHCGKLAASGDSASASAHHSCNIYSTCYIWTLSVSIFTILIYVFNQEGPVEIQYLFYEGVLVKIGSKDKEVHITTINKHKTQTYTVLYKQTFKYFKHSEILYRFHMYVPWILYITYRAKQIDLCMKNQHLKSLS